MDFLSSIFQGFNFSIVSDLAQILLLFFVRPVLRYANSIQSEIRKIREVDIQNLRERVIVIETKVDSSNR